MDVWKPMAFHFFIGAPIAQIVKMFNNRGLLLKIK